MNRKHPEQMDAPTDDAVESVVAELAIARESMLVVRHKLQQLHGQLLPQHPQPNDDWSDAAVLERLESYLPGYIQRMQQEITSRGEMVAQAQAQIRELRQRAVVAIKAIVDAME